jgi:hypothetical protein
MPAETEDKTVKQIGRPKGSKNSPTAKKTGPKFTVREREQRKARVLQLAVRDFTCPMIAEMTGISEHQVYLWISEQKAQWRQSQVENREQLIAQKRAQYEEVRREAWLQWEKSKEEWQKRIESSGSKGDLEWNKLEVAKESRHAAKIFLDVILDTYRQERSLLGIDAERKDAGIQVNVGLNWQNILLDVAMQSDPVATLEERINALTPEEIKALPPISPEEVLMEEQMELVPVEDVEDTPYTGDS